MLDPLNSRAPVSNGRKPPRHGRDSRLNRLRRLSSSVVLASLLTLVLASTAQADVLLRTADPFAVLAGSTVTNTGDTVINGDLGLHPGTSVTGFPPGTVNGAQHISNAVAQRAKTDLVTAYQDAAGRSQTATAPPDVGGGQTFTPGVYRTGSVASLGLTGNVTLNAQGNPNAVFIFQIESTLTTATDSSVTLINGAQACNVFWQVGSSATLGTRTAFKGNILALESIDVSDSVTVDGRLLARDGAVTLINDTVTRSRCAPGTGPGAGTGDGPGTGAGRGPDRTGPRVRILAPPGIRLTLRPPASNVCTTRDFTARIRVSDRAGIRRVKVYLDGRVIRDTKRTRFGVRIKVRGLRVGRHRITVVARDRALNRSRTTRYFGRCAVRLAAPLFTG
jgi:Ice-binding-like